MYRTRAHVGFIYNDKYVGYMFGRRFRRRYRYRRYRRRRRW